MSESGLGSWARGGGCRLRSHFAVQAELHLKIQSKSAVQRVHFAHLFGQHPSCYGIFCWRGSGGSTGVRAESFVGVRTGWFKPFLRGGFRIKIQIDNNSARNEIVEGSMFGTL